MYDRVADEQVFNTDEKPVHAANRYHLLMCKGLSHWCSSLKTVCFLPINRQWSNRVFIPGFSEETEHFVLRYLPAINIPGLKNIMGFFGAFFDVLVSEKESILISDGLVLSAALGGNMAAKIRGFHRCMLLTDLPVFLNSGESFFGRLKTTVNNRMFRSADSFILLTHQMNEVVNTKHKPYIVLEGHVDSDMALVQKKNHSTEKKIILYAGSLEEEYGLINLCEGFAQIYRENEELHIYGNGSCRDKVIMYSKTVKNIVYKGVVTPSEIVDKELEASLLVNPRSPEGEFTKYSFPSKTMEYMVSGTPVVMCKLPGMPSEYAPYLFLFTDGSTRSISEKLRELLDMNPEELAIKGENARQFVLKNKTNIAQAEKVVNFLEKNKTK